MSHLTDKGLSIMVKVKKKFELYKDETYDNSVKPFLKDIELMALDGYSLVQMAKSLGVCHNAFYKFTKQHPELQAAIEEGYIKVEKQLESAMIKAAKGYFYTEEKTIERFDAEGNLICTVVEKHKKYRPQNTMLLMNMLRYINKERWADSKVDDKDINIELDEKLEEYAK